MKYLPQIFLILVLIGAILKLNNIEGGGLISKIGIYGTIISQSIEIMRLNKRIKNLENGQ